MQYAVSTILAIVASAVLATIPMVPFGTDYLSAQQDPVVRDSQTILLEGMTIPAGIYPPL
jgi:hypothetical protein